MRRRAEAEQPHTFAALDAGHAQAAESDDAGAQQRRGFEIIESRGQRNREVRARHGILGVAAVHGVSGEGGRIAQVFFAAAAVLAGSVDPGHPCNAESCALGLPLRRRSGGPE